MAIKYRVTTRARLNGDGIHGVWLLLASPAIQAIGWFWYASSPGWWPIGLIAITGLTFLGGFVLLLVGRDFDSVVDEI